MTYSPLLGGLLVASMVTVDPSSRFALGRMTDKAGKPALGVASSDFIVEEDGERRAVVAVVPASYPIAVLIDTSAFARDEFMQLRQAVRRFVAGLSGREIVLYTFGSRSSRALDFTNDSGLAARAVDELFADREGEMHLMDAFVEAATHLGTRNSRVTTLVVISAGGADRSYRQTPDVLRALSRSRAIVRVINRRIFPATTARSDAESHRVDSSFGDENLLRALAERTQGRYLQVLSSAEYDAALHEITEELKSEVMIEYAVPPKSRPTRGVQLGVRVPGVTIQGIGLSEVDR